jgi:undecaprenyl-diphosphatase
MLFLGLVYRRQLIPLLFLAVLVSYSRIYIGVHWPLDAAAGMALGGLIGWCGYILFRKLYRESTVSDNENGADSLLDNPGGGAAE